MPHFSRSCSDISASRPDFCMAIFSRFSLSILCPIEKIVTFCNKSCRKIPVLFIEFMQAFHHRFITIKPVIQKSGDPYNRRGADMRFFRYFTVRRFLHQHLCNPPSVNQPFKFGRCAQIIKKIPRFIRRR